MFENSRNESELDILISLRNGDENGLKAAFETYYEALVLKVYQIIFDQSQAEDLVQELFLELWQKRNQLEQVTNLKAYLFKSAYNRTLNLLKSKKLSFDSIDGVDVPEDQEFYKTQLEKEQKLLHIQKAIEELPEKCRIVFTLSKFEEKSYADIAKELDISIKTVEHQVSKALKILRNKAKYFNFG